MRASFLLDPDQFSLWLKAKNLSVRRLSDVSGISRTSFRQWQQGRRIRQATANRLRAELGIPSNLLIDAAQRILRPAPRPPVTCSLTRFLESGGFLSSHDRRKPCEHQLSLFEEAV